jgi:hypothetical protein
MGLEYLPAIFKPEMDFKLWKASMDLAPRVMSAAHLVIVGKL